MAFRVDEIDDLRAELELERHDARFLGELRGHVRGRRGGQGGRRFLGHLVGDVEGKAAREHEQHGPHEKEGQLRKARQDAEPEYDHGHGANHAPVARELGEHVASEIVLRRRPRHDDACRQRHQKGRDLADEAVTDREQAVGVAGLREGVVVLQQSHGQAAQQVHGRDDNGGDGVAADELRGAVHGPVEVGLVGDLPAPDPRLVRVISWLLSSASMAICLPGMASRVNRAATSATRPAPLVITTKWMTIKIRKTTRPTRTEPPMTKCPKLSMTMPA